jgi:hypothetical protein
MPYHRKRRVEPAHATTKSKISLLTYEEKIFSRNDKSVEKGEKTRKTYFFRIFFEIFKLFFLKFFRLMLEKIIFFL